MNDPVDVETEKGKRMDNKHFIEEIFARFVAGCLAGKERRASNCLA